MSKTAHIPQLGSRIELHVASYIYSSQISDIIDNDNFLILGPIKYGRIVDIPENSEVKISFTIKDKGRCWFKGIVDRVYKSKIYKLQIKKIQEIVKLQQREYYRLRKIIDVDITVNESKYFKTFAEDISGKGIKIVTRENFSIGDSLELKLTLSDETVQLTGKIVRTEIDYKLGNNIYGVCFESIDRETKDKIIKYIFKEQRKLRKKGMK